MARLRHLDRPGPGIWVIRALGLVTGAIAAMACVALVRASPLLLILAAPLLALVAWITVRLWRVGVYESSVGIVVQGLLRREVLPWNAVLHARVGEVQVGFRPVRAVVLATRDGSEIVPYLWNQSSFLMLGHRDGVPALAARVDAAIQRHQM